MESKHAQKVLALHGKSYSKWILYFFVGIFPVIFGITVLISMIFFPVPQLPPGIPDYITAAIPFFFVLIAFELIVARLMGKKLYRLNDSVSSISMG